ncbi:hypothetical protein COS81_04360, partial [candidate division WWE3 bacterium CG06_land_8_20_14_3_00_42_16]
LFFQWVFENDGNGNRTIYPHLKTKAENPTPNSLVVTYYDTAMPPEVYQGELYEYFKTFGGDAAARIKLISTTYQIIVSSLDFTKMRDSLKLISSMNCCPRFYARKIK